MIDGLIKVTPFDIGNICGRLGTLDTCVRYDCWHIWVGEGCRIIGYDIWMAAIGVGRPKIPLQLLHCPGKNSVALSPISKI